MPVYRYVGGVVVLVSNQPIEPPTEQSLLTEVGVTITTEADAPIVV